jgi:AcrR family transcriptional regulator
VSRIEEMGKLPVSPSQDLAPEPLAERSDAARNRARLLEAARRLVNSRGAHGVTMDDIAAAAGVGKGTLFRRFGTRAGLMMVLLDEDEKASQQAFLFGPPPLGPGAPPLDRLIAFGRERICFVHNHHELLSAASRGPHTRHVGAAAVQRRHVLVLLQAAQTTGDLDVQTDALLALLNADYIEHQLTEGGHTQETLSDAWATLASKLCGR